jgi:hypothetical protein
MATLVEELRELIAAFDENNVEYALCGGLAMAAHGFVRATLDIDLLIRTESLEKAYKIGREKGFDIRGLDISFKERATREEIDFLGEKLSVVSRDGLIKMKRLAGRPQDVADIERLQNGES